MKSILIAIATASIAMTAVTAQAADLKKGQELLVKGNCAACHGADGKGSLAHNLPFGAPNLTDNTWLYGGSAGTIEQSLLKGRNGVMPAFKDTLGEDKIHVITAYVYRLSRADDTK